MKNKKIYEVSKELGFTSKQIIEEANKNNINASSHMNILNEQQIELIKNSLINSNAPRLATSSQIEQINKMISNGTMENFVKQYSADLSKELRQLDIATQISSSKGQYNPLLSERYLTEINFNPRKATSNEISQWLMAPQYHNQEIRHLSEYVRNAVGQYGRAIYALNTEKSFKYLLTPCDSSNSNLVNQTDYLNSYRTCLDTLRKMNIKYQFSKMDLQVMEDGVGFYVWTETADTITFLQLPTDYCYITAPWTYGWMFAIDLTYFDRMIGLPEVLPELVDAYKLFVQKRLEGYKGEKLAPFQYFNLPVEKSFCLTFNPGKSDKLPPLTGALGASLDVLSYRDLLKKKSVLDLYKLIAMKVPIDKDTKQMAIPYDVAMNFIQMIQQQMPENIVAFASPFDSQEVAANQVDSMDKLVDLGDNNVFSALGMSAAMFGKDNKNAGQLQISTQLMFDYGATHMYNQFANLANWILSQKTKTYKWKVKFWGNKINETKEQDSAFKVVTSANVPVEYLMANLGFEPFEVESFINLTNKLDIKSKMTPLQSMNTQSSKSGDIGGRPLKDVSDMQDSGEKSREYKDNIVRK